MIEFRSLHPDEIQAWIDQITLVFSNENNREWVRSMFTNSWNDDPEPDLQGICVAVQDGRIVSSVQVLKRRIYLCGVEMPMGGISAVSTLPEARRQGLSTRLLEDSIRVMEAWGQPVSMLQTGIHGFYSRLGWEQVSLFSKNLRLDDHVPEAPVSYYLRSMDFTNDLQQVKSLYAAYSSRYNGPVVRGHSTWEKYKRNPPDRWWVAEYSGRVAAFLCIDVEDDQVSVAEFGAFPYHEGVFDALLAYGLEALNRQIETIPCPGAIASQRQVVEWQEHTHWMVRLNRPLKVAGRRVESSQELATLMVGSPERGKPGDFLFWGNDGF